MKSTVLMVYIEPLGGSLEPPQSSTEWLHGAGRLKPTSGSHDARRMKPCCSACGVACKNCHRQTRPPASWGASRGPLNPPRGSVPSPQHPGGVQGSHRAAPRMLKGFAVLAASLSTHGGICGYKYSHNRP